MTTTYTITTRCAINGDWRVVSPDKQNGMTRATAEVAFSSRANELMNIMPMHSREFIIVVPEGPELVWSGPPGNITDYFDIGRFEVKWDDRSFHYIVEVTKTDS